MPSEQRRAALLQSASRFPGVRSAARFRQILLQIPAPAPLAAALLLSVIGPLLAVSLSPAAVVQHGNLRVTLLAQVQPYKLPRSTTAPIAVAVSGHVAAVDGGVPDQLQGLRIMVNRHAILRSDGLPSCGLARIVATTSTTALRKCGSALIGSGRFSANIVFPEQGYYATQGRLLVFSGHARGRPVIYAQIYSSHPFATSFVIPFAMRRVDRGPYGTELVAHLPDALGEWGYVDRIKLTLRREYRLHGKSLSYYNASCPAIAGAERASYHLAYATFSFLGHQSIGVQVNKSCGVKE